MHIFDQWKIKKESWKAGKDWDSVGKCLRIEQPAIKLVSRIWFADAKNASTPIAIRNETLINYKTSSIFGVVHHRILILHSYIETKKEMAMEQWTVNEIPQEYLRV